MDRKILLETIKQVISEATKVNFAGHEFVLKTDVNEDPKKKGLKIQFIPTEFGKLSPTKQNDIAIELEKRLEDGLSQYELKIERDRNLKNPSIIGFFVYIEYFDKLVRQILQDQNPEAQAGEEEEADIAEFLKTRDVIKKVTP